MGIFNAFKRVLSGSNSTSPVEKFRVQFSQLNTFLDWQESVVKKMDNRVVFDSPTAKLRYFNFAMGAIDRLANTLSNDSLSQEFFEAAGQSLGINLFQDLHEGSRHLDSYGISTDKNAIISNKLGYEAMTILLDIVAGKQPKELMNQKGFMLNELLAIPAYMLDRAGQKPQESLSKSCPSES